MTGEAKRKAAHKRTMDYCRGCGGTCSTIRPHPFGVEMVSCECPACGNTVTLVRKPNGGLRKPRKPGNARLGG